MDRHSTLQYDAGQNQGGRPTIKDLVCDKYGKQEDTHRETDKRTNGQTNGRTLTHI